MIWILILSVISAILYRAGGMSKDPSAEPKWIPVWLRQSWVRDWLCPMCVLLLWFPGFNWGLIWWLLAYGATGGMLTTYWDWLFKFDNFWFSGFMVGLAGLFLIGLGQPWMPLVGRSFLLAILWGAWSLAIGKDYVEEMGRGFFLVSTMAVIGA